MKPICIDLFCGLGGWTEGFLAEGWDVIGFDIERHDYGTGGYPGQLVLQDVLTLHGSQFRSAAMIVASPPCQAYSYRSQPWGALWREHNRMDDDGGPPIDYRGKDPICNDLFRACFRIQSQASKAAGRHVPMIVENVKGAQPWVGSAAWHHGSYYLWGDVPALMPITLKRRKSEDLPVLSAHTDPRRGQKNGGGSWFNKAHNTESGVGQNPVNGVKCGGSKGDDWFAHHNTPEFDRRAGVKQGGEWWHDPNSMTRRFSSRSDSRKAASAAIAKIPFPLAQHIARVFKP